MEIAAHVRAIANTLLVVLASTSIARAQTTVSGSVSDANVGPLGSGTYEVTGNLNVPAGQTLVITGDAVLKFQTGTRFDIYGTLVCAGQFGAPVVFTSEHDDSVGLPIDGLSSVGNPGDWQGLHFHEDADSSLLSHAEVRFFGADSSDGVRLSNANIQIEFSRISDGLGSPLDLSGNSLPIIEDCCLANGTGPALSRAPLQAVADFRNITAAGNGAGDRIVVSDGTLTSNLLVQPFNCIKNTLTFADDIIIPVGLSLEVRPGLIFKFEDSRQVHANGRLALTGQFYERIHMTSMSDDSVGGDTNSDGPSAGTPGDWGGVSLGPSSAGSILQFVDVRFFGANAQPAINLDQASIDIEYSCLRDGASNALDLNTDSRPRVMQCSFINNTGIAVVNAAIQVLPDFSNNTASANSGDYIQITEAEITQDLRIEAVNLLNDELALLSGVHVHASAQLDLIDSMVLKFAAGQQLEVDGSLVSLGSLSNPTFFTSTLDDSIGLDLDGFPSSGSPGDWGGLIFRAGSSSSVIENAEVRFFGANSLAGLELGQTEMSLCSVLVRDGLGSAVDLNGVAMPSISDCEFRNNQGFAIEDADINILPLLLNNTASGNAAGDFIEVTQFTPNLSFSLNATPENTINAVLLAAQGAHIPVGQSMRLFPGLTIKFALGTQFTVDGALSTLGTLEAPVIFTAETDFQLGGDSSAGAGPTPGYWQGLSISSQSTFSSIGHLAVRFAGFAGAPGLECSSPNASLRCVTVEQSLGDGFCLAGVDSASHLIAYNCAANGVSLSQAAFDVEHITSVANQTGVFAQPSWSGSIRNSIAWNNSTANTSGLSPEQWRFSNGEPLFGGVNGNLNLDPVFVDESHGDLSLSYGSPCIDSGDPFSSPDPDATRADMGAIPFDHCSPLIYCSAKLNSQTCLPSIGFSGSPSVGGTEAFQVSAHEVVPSQAGLLLWTINGRAALPFKGGTLCIQPPAGRGPIQNSAGTAAACSGSLSLDFNAFAQTSESPFLTTGSIITVQYLYRDPGDPFGVGLTEGLEFGLCP